MGLPNSWMFYKGKPGKIPLKLMITRGTPILGNLSVHIYICILYIYTLYIYICILYTLYIIYIIYIIYYIYYIHYTYVQYIYSG